MNGFAAGACTQCGVTKPSAAAAAALPTNPDDMMEEIKNLRDELASMRNAIRVAAAAGNAGGKK